MTTPKSECERLMSTLMPFAEKMLNEHRAFHPYGGVIGKTGDISVVGLSEEKQLPDSQALLEAYRRSFVDSAGRGEIRAAAVVYDAKVNHPGRHAKVDAIVIELDHKKDYSAVVAFPYAFNQSGDLVLGNPFASKGEGAIFNP